MVQANNIAPPVEPKRSWMKFLSHPVLGVMGIVGSIASLISIPLAIYFYFGAKEYPQLTYYINPVKAVIVRTGEASRLTANFDNKEIKSDITAIQIAIWNQGNKPIRKENVLKSIIIQTENNAPILEATLRKSSRDVVQLSLNPEELQAGHLAISWNILEQNDGGVIQLIYAGSPDLNINVDGVIEGQSQINRLEFSQKIKSANEQYSSLIKERKRNGYFLLGAGFLLALLAGYGVVRRKRRKISIKLSDWFYILQPVVFIAIGMFMLLSAQEPGPPFGF